MKKMYLFTDNGKFRNYFSSVSSDLPEIEIHPTSDWKEFSTNDSSDDHVFILEYPALFNDDLDIKRIIYIFDYSQFKSDELERLEKCSLSRYLFWIDVNQPLSLYRKQFNNIEFTNRNEIDLSTVAANSLEQLHKIKQIHASVVPVRKEEIKGIKFVSKYMAGDGNGGEFFDFIKLDQRLLYFQSNTNSYVVSSLIISQIENLKFETTINNDTYEYFLNQMNKEIEELGMDHETDNIKIDLLILDIDLSEYKVSGYKFGDSILISNNGFYLDRNKIKVDSSNLEKSFFDFELDRKEKLCILSAGYVQNSNEFINNQSVENYLRDHWEDQVDGLINEMFFQIKKNYTGLLPKDASVFFLEVDKNVIKKI